MRAGRAPDDPRRGAAGTLRPALQFDIAPKIGDASRAVDWATPSARRSPRRPATRYQVTLRERTASEVAAGSRAKEAKMLSRRAARGPTHRDRKMASEAEFQQIVMERETARRREVIRGCASARPRSRRRVHRLVRARRARRHRRRGFYVGVRLSTPARSEAQQAIRAASRSTR
jgi:hypothetical protein